MAEFELGFPTNSFIPLIVSAFLVAISQFSLALVPHFLPLSSIVLLIALSAVVLIAIAVLGGVLKRLLKVKASAPALVLFNILFIIGVYTAVIRKYAGVSASILFYSEVMFLIIGLYSTITGDPGLVAYGHISSAEANSAIELEAKPCFEDASLPSRARFCQKCKRYIEGFDHHCPAFGNCIGRKNHRLFMLLLLIFVVSEVSYANYCSRCIHLLGTSGFKGSLSRNLVIGTACFCILQVFWQVIFLMWHAYCICFNLKTDEWINWKSYPEFQQNHHSQAGTSLEEMAFTNPYDKGFTNNVAEFLKG